MLRVSSEASRLYRKYVDLRLETRASRLYRQYNNHIKLISFGEGIDKYSLFNKLLPGRHN
ncbi:MAG TPA: hypothetical protein ENF37_07415 [Beggiatoa sp.]|nr:hypothetical protein [Beggiatoa sp.]